MLLTRVGSSLWGLIRSERVTLGRISAFCGYNCLFFSYSWSLFICSGYKLIRCSIFSYYCYFSASNCLTTIICLFYKKNLFKSSFTKTLFCNCKTASFKELVGSRYAEKSKAWFIIYIDYSRIRIPLFYWGVNSLTLNWWTYSFTLCWSIPFSIKLYMTLRKVYSKTWL